MTTHLARTHRTAPLMCVVVGYPSQCTCGGRVEQIRRGERSWRTGAQSAGWGAPEPMDPSNAAILTQDATWVGLAGMASDAVINGRKTNTEVGTWSEVIFCCLFINAKKTPSRGSGR